MVVLELMGLLKLNDVVKLLFVYHPLKVYPILLGSSGSLTVFPTLHVVVNRVVFPSLNVTVAGPVK